MSINTKIEICLNTIDKVKNFVSKALKFVSEIDVVSGKYVVNGKSMIGVFSLNLLEPVYVVIHSSAEEEINKFVKEMEEFK